MERGIKEMFEELKPKIPLCYYLARNPKKRVIQYRETAIFKGDNSL